MAFNNKKFQKAFYMRMKLQKKKRNSKRLWNQNKANRQKGYIKFKNKKSIFQKGFALFVLGGLLVLALIYFIGVIF